MSTKPHTPKAIRNLDATIEEPELAEEAKTLSVDAVNEEWTKAERMLHMELPDGKTEDGKPRFKKAPPCCLEYIGKDLKAKHAGLVERSIKGKKLRLPVRGTKKLRKGDELTMRKVDADALAAKYPALFKAN